MICKKCNISFKTWTVIDGKKKILNSRKYCLTCSPYKQGNTRRLENNHLYKKDELHTCIKCNRSYIYDRDKGFRYDVCNSCIATDQRTVKRNRLIELAGGKCCKCNYNKYYGALAFHHLDPNTKLFNISGSCNRKFSDLLNEIKKCILVCANCHAEIHGSVTQSG